jgi:hypothetical protein
VYLASTGPQPQDSIDLALRQMGSETHDCAAGASSTAGAAIVDWLVQDDFFRPFVRRLESGYRNART